MLFEGFRDYSTILRLMGEMLTHATELNRLRGMRQLPSGNSTPSDLEKARRQISSLLTTVPSDLCFLNAMFDSSVSFHPIANVSSSTAATDGRTVNNVIEGRGVGYESEPPFSSSGNTWFTAAPGGGASDYFENAAPPVLIFDLGSDLPITEFSLWNYPSGTNNGASSVQLRFATASEGDAGFENSIFFKPVFEPKNDDIRRQSFSFGFSIEARYVEVTILDNYYTQDNAGGDRVGLHEVAFARGTLGPNDISGVAAANNSVEQGLTELVGVRSFLNGETNILGLDPDFMVFLQDDNIASDSFEIFVDRIKESGSNKPLTIALNSLADARNAYESFRGSVDQVVEELAGLDTTFQNRFFEITGYTKAESEEIITDPDNPRVGQPRWNGSDAKPNSGSELDVVAENIRLLEERLVTYNESYRPL